VAFFGYPLAHEGEAERAIQRRTGDHHVSKSVDAIRDGSRS
jgi:hypothetical protein